MEASVCYDDDDDDDDDGGDSAPPLAEFIVT